MRPALAVRALAVRALAAASLAGCAAGPTYTRPDDAVEVPVAFRVAPEGPPVLDAAAAEDLADAAWWSLFGDPTLDALVAAALAQSPDVAAAVAHLDEAAALARVAGAALWPELRLEVNAAYRRLPSIGQFANVGRETATYAVSGVLTWQLDLFGRVRRSREAAQAEVMASEATRRGVLLSLAGQVADTYFRWSAQESLAQVARDTIAARVDTLALVRQRELGGVSNRVEIANAEANLALAEAALPRALAQVGALENELAALIGQAPGAVARPATPLAGAALPPPVPAGLPSALLERRPDLVEAAEAVHAATARVGAAQADLLPSLALSAAGGVANIDLRDLFDGDSLYYQVGGSLQQPLFQGGRLLGNQEAAEARVRQATARFARVALNAFREVSTALYAATYTRQALEAEQREVDAYAEALELVTQRYAAGRSSYLDVLQVDQALFDARNRLVGTRLDALRAYVALYLALGGGWAAAEALEGPAGAPGEVP